MDQLLTKADIDDVSLELISSIFQSELIQASVLAPTVENFTSLVQDGADSVKIPRAGSFVVEKKQAAQKATSQKLVISTDKINFDEHAVTQGVIEDIASIQSNVPVVAEYIKRMASAHALQVDKDIYTQMKLTSSSAPDHRIVYAAGGAPTKADFIAARKLLKKQNVPNDGRWYAAVNPDMEAVIVGLSDFVDADKWMSGSEQVKSNGMLGRAYGFNILTSNVVTDDYMIFYHSSHVGIAFQKQARLQEQYKLEYLGLLLSLDQLYGVKVMDTGKRGVLVGSAS